MDLSICIVSMNHSSVLKNCIQSIYRFPPKHYSYEITALKMTRYLGLANWLILKTIYFYFQIQELKTFLKIII